ncbi:SIS domain-containing protein [Romboutsia lituseburensis]|uniref:Galactosamine 6-phosphate isomerase AgaS n=1 Tax=Romboutsia lituseburensis DSM 797 TaxID=1121325 RepID=A0A1G9N790_9FIRM|nr:SIS domain-containing protein [Romboutsia lituseburensis]CEH34164.1 Sugar isomerase, AgaS [Romboutsia lituseburensis]SDL82379.1 galactosamine 6-phosphate isomerase AgaS [Romboutsia lituseburensis DSM 797]
MDKIGQQLLGINLEILKQINGLNTAKEITQQPTVWKEAVLNIKKNKNKINDFMNKFSSIKDSRIILTGAGTSAFAGETCEPYLTNLLNKRVEAIATTDLVASPQSYFIKGIPTLLISFARSGNSPESVHAVKLANQLVDDLYQVIITCNKEGKLAENTKDDEKSLLLLMPKETNDLGFAMTSSFTTMVLSAMAIFNMSNIESFVEDVDKLSVSVNDFLVNNTHKVNKLVNEEFERIVYLGSSTSKAIARESALKVLELTGGIVNANYDTPLGFRHGPKSVIDDTTITVIYISNYDYTRMYDLDLAREMLTHRKRDKVVVIGCDIDNDISNKADYIFELDNINYSVKNEALLPLQQIIFGQMLSFLKAINLNITPDNPCPTGEVNRVVQGVILHDLI